MNIEANALGAPAGPITVEQWGAMEGPPHYELVDGRLQEKPEVAFWHDILLFRLVGFMIAHINRHGLGQLVGSTTPMRVSAFGGRKPDLFLVPPDQYHRVGKNVFHGVPPFVGEILSATTEHIDRTDKRDEYARLGVGQYWLIDFPNRAIEVYHLRDLTEGGRAYELAETVKGDAVFRPALFPGLEIPLAEVWPTEFENLPALGPGD
jgi:Uma2 family endonuclease